MTSFEPEIRDSINTPLRIDELTVPGMPGTIGMTLCPGKKSLSVNGSPWNRDLDIDMRFIIYSWGAGIMVTLLEAQEFELLGVKPIKKFASTSMRLKWMHLEIADGEIPDEKFEKKWPLMRTRLIGALSAGGKVLVHCRGGLGRTGMIVARLLVETGMSPGEAIQSVRAAREGAIETLAQEQYVRCVIPALPASLRRGLTMPLHKILTSENVAQNSSRTRELALTIFHMVLARWCTVPCSLQMPRLQAELLGISENMLKKYSHSHGASLPADVIKRIDMLSQISISLKTLVGHNVRQEVMWLGCLNRGNAPLLQLLDNQSPLDYIKTHGIAGLETVCSYLEEKAAHLQANERYLVCLGVSSTLLDTPYVQLDMVLAMAMQGVKNSQNEWQARIMAARDLPTAIPIGEHHVLLPRPHLQALVEYIQQHPNLDVAIISGATREYIDKFVGMVAQELLEMCQFVWSREDEPCYYMRGAGTTIKSLENIPELKGYRPGRILMVDHNAVFPYECHLRIRAFYGEHFTATRLENENSLQDVIRRLSILTQVDDIIALRKNEDAEDAKYGKQVTEWANQHKISMFSADYAEKMDACPFKPPTAIDAIKARVAKYQSINFDF